MTQRYQVIFRRLVFSLIFLLPSNDAIFAGESVGMEYKIKAAYLYNFTKFIYWPEDNSPTFNLCVFGETPLFDILAPLESKTAIDKPIRILAFNNPKQLNQCHIVYFENLSKTNENILIDNTLAKTLTVGSQADFTQLGGMIGFILDDERVKLLVNLKALKRQGLSISAKLIEVSTLAED